MSESLTIVARIEAEAGQEELVKRELIKLIEPTLEEAGCLQYDLHEDNENPALFLFFENWESRELWLAHMEAAHIAAYKEATEGAVASFALYEMTKVLGEASAAC
ncbi:MAG: putative quinol monooxygenase [Verrucomicrobiota bacterium]